MFLRDAAKAEAMLAEIKQVVVTVTIAAVLWLDFRVAIQNACASNTR